MLTLLLLVTSAKGSIKEEDSEFRKREKETRNGVMINSIEPRDFVVGKETSIRMKVEPPTSGFCNVRFGETQTKAYVDKGGKVIVRVPLLAPGIYLVAISYDGEKWSNEMSVICSHEEASEIWVLLFPLSVTICVVVMILYCGRWRLNRIVAAGLLHSPARRIISRDADSSHRRRM